MGKRRQNNENIPADLPIPLNGLSQERAFMRQRSLTSASELNFRSFDPLTGRARGGVRQGLVKVFNTQVNGSNAIQDINALDTVAAPPVAPYDGFVYAEASGSGFGVANNTTGTSVASGLGNVASFSLVNSTWDLNGNLYVAEQNVGSAVAGNLYCYNSSQTLVWGPVATPTLPAARCVVGMCVVGQLLFIAYITTTPYTGSIYVYNILKGAVVNAPWVSLTFSSAAHNVLSNIGYTLGVASYSTGFQTYLLPQFNVVNGTALPTSTALTTTAWVGTNGNEAVKVVNDGTSNFYMIAPVTSAMLVKISIAGVIIWQTNALDVGNGGAGNVAVALVYDNGGATGTPQLVGVSTGTTEVIGINLATGTLLFAVTATSASWSEIDSDNQGNFTLWENSQSSNDVMGLNNILATAWGPSTLANAIHTGCSVSKVPAHSPASTATRQIRLLAVSGGNVYWIAFQLVGSVTTGSSALVYSGVATNLAVNQGVMGPGIAEGTYITAVNTATQTVTLSAAATVTVSPATYTITGPIPLTGGNAQTLHPSGVIFSAQNGLNMFYADGAGAWYYNAQNDAMVAWTATTSGTFPTVSTTVPAYPRQIETWRGRSVPFGYVTDPQQVYMSAINDPFNWNFSPVTPTSTQAVALVASLGGFGGDFVTGFCPYDDDTAIIFCQHSIWQLTGDPAAGGQLDLVSGGGPGSNGIGAAWGRAWCKDPMGQVWFFGSQCAVWKMTPGALPVRQSQPIEKMVESVDLSLNIVKMYYDLQNQSVQIFISPLTVGPTTNFCWEERVNAWHPDSFAVASMQPLTTYINQSDNPNSRVVMLGCQDGYIRCFSSAAANDDGQPINWNVWLGPIQDRNMMEQMLVDLQGVLGRNSGAVQVDVFTGRTAEDAINGSSKWNGTWTVGSYIANSGRNHRSYINRAGIDIYVRLSGVSFASLERINYHYRTLGEVRSRQ